MCLFSSFFFFIPPFFLLVLPAGLGLRGWEEAHALFASYESRSVLRKCARYSSKKCVASMK